MLGRIEGERRGDDRGWDGWMASPTQWTWLWVNSGSWWWTGRPGVLRFMESQRVRHGWATELNWNWCLGISELLGSVDWQLSPNLKNFSHYFLIFLLTPTLVLNFIIHYVNCLTLFHKEILILILFFTLCLTFIDFYCFVFSSLIFPFVVSNVLQYLILDILLFSFRSSIPFLFFIPSFPSLYPVYICLSFLFTRSNFINVSVLFC